MSLSNAETKEIQNLIRKEIKTFLDSNTLRQFEDKFLEKIQKEMKRGKLEKEMKDTIQKMFTEFYRYMWDSRGQWENRIKNT